MNNPNLNTQGVSDRNHVASNLVVSSMPDGNNNQNQRANRQIPRPPRFRYPTTCCLCFRIHQGFINIVYLDTARFFWGIIFGAMVFTRGTSITIDYASAGVTLIAIIIQSFFAVISARRALPINDYNIFRRYFLSKILYIAASFFENIVKNIVICRTNMRPATEPDDCTNNSLGGQIVMNMFLFAIESYFAFIVYVFYVKTRRGDYGELGSRPNYGDHITDFSQNQQLILEAIEVEVHGVKIKPPQQRGVAAMEKDVEPIKKSVPLSQDQQLGPRGMTIYKPKTKYEMNEVVMVDLTEEVEEVEEGLAIIVTGTKPEVDIES